MELILLIIVPLLFAGFYLFWYNAFISTRQHVIEAWSDIDTQLKRRHDLIPNLVKVVQGYAEHEKNLFERIAELRTQTTGVSQIAAKTELEQQLTAQLKQLRLVSELYPNLKADQQFKKLAEELNEMEDQINAARRIYNGNVQHYNQMTETFPTSVIAHIHGFKSQPFFAWEVEEPTK